MTNDALEDFSIAILHDRMAQMGGGTQFALEAARVLNAPIYTMYVNPDWEQPDDITIHTLQQDRYTTGLTGKLLEWKESGGNPLEGLGVMIDMAEASEELEQYDVILQSGSMAKSYLPAPHQTIINYPHSPPRWLYDLYRERINRTSIPGVGLVFRVATRILRALDKSANAHVDKFIANSEIVSDRIKRYYNRESGVVYPPITTDWEPMGDDGYFVAWSRLAPEKRMHLIVEAFQGLDEQLVIAGTGSEQSRLEDLAEGHDNIEIRGYVEDIQSLVGNATAVVYTPVEEDFGMVAAEGLMAGKPVLGVKEGYTQHQIEPGVTGELFDPTTESIRETVQSFDPDDYGTDVILDRAEKYSYETFAQELTDAVVDAYQNRTRLKADTQQ